MLLFLLIFSLIYTWHLVAVLKMDMLPYRERNSHFIRDTLTNNKYDAFGWPCRTKPSQSITLLSHAVRQNTPQARLYNEAPNYSTKNKIRYDTKLSYSPFSMDPNKITCLAFLCRHVA